MITGVQEMQLLPIYNHNYPKHKRCNENILKLCTTAGFFIH